MKNTIVRGYIVSNNLHYIVLDRVCSLGLGVQQLIFVLCTFRQCWVDERPHRVHAYFRCFVVLKPCGVKLS